LGPKTRLARGIPLTTFMMENAPRAMIKSPRLIVTALDESKCRVSLKKKRYPMIKVKLK
jgi:hypothetical protein